MAVGSDSQGRGMMSPGVMPPKSVEMDSSKKDIGSDSNSLPGQERSRPESDKQVYICFVSCIFDTCAGLQSNPPSSVSIPITAHSPSPRVQADVQNIYC